MPRGLLFRSFMLPMQRILTLAACASMAAAHAGLQAQQLLGMVQDTSVAGATIVLMQARGENYFPIDSTIVGPTGEFAFHQHFSTAGFHQLALHDTDRVKLVLDAREPMVDLYFEELPLADHLQVRVSAENKRLRDLQYVTSETAAVRAEVAQRRLGLTPADTAVLAELARIEAAAIRAQEQYLADLEGNAGSYLARVVRTDRLVQQARGKGPMAVAAACDFSNPELLRSAVYDNAVMAFMQNLNAVHEEQFSNAADTLMRLSSGHPACHAYMLEQLVDLFSLFGPAAALQHVVDRYVAPAASGGSSLVSPGVLRKVEGLLSVSVGRTAPDMALQEGGPPLRLASVVAAQRLTALVFYSSTCEHCLAQMPALKTVYQRYAGQGFSVVGIALDADSTDFQNTLREQALPWKNYTELNGWGAASAQAFHVRSTPSLFLLDPDMTIVARPADAAELGRNLQELLGPPSAPPTQAR